MHVGSRMDVDFRVDVSFSGNRMSQDTQSELSDAEKILYLNASLVQATVSCCIVIDTLELQLGQITNIQFFRFQF